uniref:Uncharacterized protein n=1 Tax=Desulfobacca acetoxidans TaxID=60893 RepID=A0A7V6A669_9BACT
MGTGSGLVGPAAALMYEEFYGLRERPFTLIPAPDFPHLSLQHKLARAGGSGIFTDSALENLSDDTRGVPRRLNTICDLALVATFAEKPAGNRRRIPGHGHGGPGGRLGIARMARMLGKTQAALDFYSSLRGGSSRREVGGFLIHLALAAGNPACCQRYRTVWQPKGAGSRRTLLGS